MKRPRALTPTALGIIGAALIFAILAFHRRWMSDDGLIVVRTVRQILEGNGPVINELERAEACTSTLWTYLLAFGSLLAPVEPSLVAVAMGWMLSVAAVAIAMDATRRWHRARGETGLLVPAGICIPLAVFPFWDYATSGLETGLSLFWIASVWWLLVSLGPDTTRRRRFVAAVVFGLGPLVRPDLAIVSAVVCVAAWLLLRPTRRQLVALLAAGLGLPIAYEIFRAGYYGVLVPLPAIAKSASGAAWGRGLAYLIDFHHPYQLWIPLLSLLAVGIVAIRAGALASRDRVLAGAPVVAGLITCLFVVRVGGDFMHGRLLLPSTFLLLLPAALLPVRRKILPALAVLVVWGVVVAIMQGDGKNHASALNVGDERLGYVWFTSKKHPVRAGDFTRRGPVPAMVSDALRTGTRLMITEGGIREPMNPVWPFPLVYVAGRLGTGGVLSPLDGMVVDTLGLGNPFGAHITATSPGLTGHEKSLPFEWIRAEFVDPAYPISRGQALAHSAARHALSCGDVAELMRSVREPMSASRFWANLTGSLRRTRLVIPSDPIEAEWKFCGSIALSARPRVSSANIDPANWSTLYLVDGVLESREHELGFASEIGVPQWVELRFARKSVSRVVLYPVSYPSPGDGFPIDLQVQIWKDGRWIDRVTRTAIPRPTRPETFGWDVPDETDRIRVVATKLPDVVGGPRLQLAEVVVQ